MEEQITNEEIVLDENNEEMPFGIIEETEEEGEE